MSTTEEWVPQDDGSELLYENGQPTTILRWPAESLHESLMRIPRNGKIFTLPEFGEILDELRQKLADIDAMGIRVKTAEFEVLTAGCKCPHPGRHLKPAGPRKPKRRKRIGRG